MSVTALNFDGLANSYLVNSNTTYIYNIPQNTNFTIEWWQYYTGNQTINLQNKNPYIFSCKDYGLDYNIDFNFEYISNLPINEPDININFSLGGTTTTVGKTYFSNIKNKWVHFAISRDNSTQIRIFMNGVKIGNTINDGSQIFLKSPPPFIGTGGTRLRIGNIHTNPSTITSFEGLIYNFLWNVNTAFYTSNTSFTPNNNITVLPSGTQLKLSNLTDVSNKNFNNPSGTISDSTITLNNIFVAIEPTLTFNSISSKTYGINTTFSLLPLISSNSSGLYTFVSENTSIATVNSSGMVTILQAAPSGINISVYQEPDSIYMALSKSRILTINKATPNITFNLPSLTYEVDSTINLTSYITSTSSGTFTSFTSSNSSIATIDGDILSILGSGNFTITASQNSSTNYVSKTQTSSTITIKSIPNINFNLPTTLILGDNNINLSNIVSSSSTGLITYESSNNNIVEVINNNLIIKSLGNVVITLNQSSNSTHNTKSINRSINILQAKKNLPLYVNSFDQLKNAINVLNVPFINITNYNNKKISSNNKQKYFTNTNKILIFS